MKLNKLLIVSGIALATALSVASCKKSSSKSTKDQLQGTWHLSQSGYDANNNNNIDAGETTADTTETIVFSSNNTGSLTGSGLSLPFTYTVNNKNLTVSALGDSINFLITTIGDHNLTMKELDDSVFTVWTK